MGEIVPGSELVLVEPVGVDEPNNGASTNVGALDSNSNATISRLRALALFVVVTAGRFVFSMDRTVFDIAPDEPSNLAMARWLSGGGHWNMFDTATFRPGLATVLAPLFWLTDDPNVIFRSGLLFGALCGGASAVFLAFLARRLTDLTGTASLFTAGAIALMPASLSASAHMWAEPLVTLLFLGSVWLLIIFFDRPTIQIGVAAVTLAAVSYTVHGRLFPLFVVVAFAVCGAFALDHRWQPAVIVAVISAVLASASTWYANLFYDHLWTDPADFNTFGSVARRLSDPLGVVRSGLGQVWYLLAASVGVFGIGVAFAVAGALGGSDKRRTRDLRLVLSATLPLFALSAVFMSNRDRVDQLVYGRYNDAVVWPLLVVGVAGLTSLRACRWSDLSKWIRWTIVGIHVVLLEVGLIVEITLRGRSLQQVNMVDMIAGLAPVLNGAERLPAIWISLGAAIVFGLLIVVVLRCGQIKPYVFAPVSALALLTAALLAHGALGLALELGEESIAVRDIEGRELPADVEVVYGFVPAFFDPGVTPYVQRYYSQLYQWYLPDHRFRLTRAGDYGAGAYVFAPVRDRVLNDAGACLLWRDPAVDMALWFSSPDCPR